MYVRNTSFPKVLLNVLYDPVADKMISNCEVEHADDICAQRLCSCESDLVAKILDLLWTGAEYDYRLNGKYIDKILRVKYDIAKFYILL